MEAMRAKYLRTRKTVHECVPGREPEVATSEIDYIITTDELRPTSSLLKQSVKTEMDRKAAIEMTMEIELLEAAQVVADAKCKSEGEKKKNADKPRNSVVEQMALMGSIQKTKAAFNDLALKLRQQAEVFFEWALETTAEDDERLGGFKTANKEVETRFTETFTALEETMKEKFKTWDGFAANTHTGNEYHDFSCQFAGAMKEFITTDKTYKEARGALKTWRDFKEATVKNLRKLEQEATKDKARRSDLRATVKVAETPKIQNSMEQYMNANPDELKQNLNLKWTVKEDIHIVYTHIYIYIYI
jgi:hypothetical protein